MHGFRLAALLCAAWLLGCGGEPPVGEVVVDGQWSGTLTSGYLPSGGEQFRVDIGESGSAIEATFVFGTNPAPSGDIDPEVGWPAEVDPQQRSIPVADGFTYRARGLRTGDRIRVDLDVTALWAEWCEMQTPHRVGLGSDDALCLPNRPWTATPFECQLDPDEMNEATPVDCLKLSLCRRTRVCDCTTSGCAASTRGLVMSFEANFTDTGGVGSFAWSSSMMEGSAGSAAARLSRD